ncbi:MAG: acetyl-CoA carboxylase biotin carboxyl carrier protein [Ginsengibacter sp.]
MDFKQIQELIKLINKSNIGELSVEENDFKITIKQKKEDFQNVIMPPPAQAPFLQPVAKHDSSKNGNNDTAKEDSFVTIKSPMIGTFYRQSSPGKPIFVNVGDEVVSGTIVCIIEAMKLFNEIESEVTGKIVKVLVEDASPVEFDQPLFLVEPSA